MILFLLVGGVPIVLLVTLVLALWLTVVELLEWRPNYLVWMWWLILVFITHFIGYLGLRGYRAYRKSKDSQAA
jgi:hypothetical protein